jgi:anthranilate phosphoribosyltransferase
MIKEAIQTVVESKALTVDQAAQVMEEIMNGEVTPAQFGAFVTALRMKGETVEELAGMARTMRAKAIRANPGVRVVDTCGTGGDGASTFNVSTAAAFVAAGAGVKIAKHGNRAMSSQAGSADVLEAMGVKIELTAAQVERCLDEVGFGFMLAPAFHPSMKYASGPRKEIGIRSVFNILGPLTNPAGAKTQVIGVPAEGVGGKMAQALRLLGSEHALIVHGLDGIDELSVTGASRVWELSRGVVGEYYVSPGDFGFQTASIRDIRGGTPDVNAGLLRGVLAGDRGPRRDMTVMNAAAAIMVSVETEFGGARALVRYAHMAEESIDSGAATEKLEALIRLTQSFK